MGICIHIFSCILRLALRRNLSLSSILCVHHPSFTISLSLDQFHMASVLWVSSGASCASDVSLLSTYFHSPLLFTFSCPEFHCRSSVHSLPLTCTCAFSICSITSTQYFSFSPVSFIFLLPTPSCPRLSSLLLPLCFAVSGSISAPKKSSRQHWNWTQ